MDQDHRQTNNTSLPHLSQLWLTGEKNSTLVKCIIYLKYPILPQVPVHPVEPRYHHGEHIVLWEASVGMHLMLSLTCATLLHASVLSLHFSWSWFIPFRFYLWVAWMDWGFQDSSSDLWHEGRIHLAKFSLTKHWYPNSFFNGSSVSSWKVLILVIFSVIICLFDFCICMFITSLVTFYFFYTL